jgi:hypothetical protein
MVLKKEVEKRRCSEKTTNVGRDMTQNCYTRVHLLRRCISHRFLIFFSYVFLSRSYGLNTDDQCTSLEPAGMSTINQVESKTPN